MLCRNGNITKNEIGAIKMQPEETYVEISADAADGFLQAVGPERELQNGIMVTQLDGTPDFGRSAYGKPPAGKKPYNAKGFDQARPAKTGYPKKPYAGERPASDQKPWTKDQKPWAKKGGKPAAGKPAGAKKFKPKRTEG
jgi:ATP-dependent RNA helicase DeaD